MAESSSNPTTHSDIADEIHVHAEQVERLQQALESETAETAEIAEPELDDSTELQVAPPESQGGADPLDTEVEELLADLSVPEELEMHEELAVHEELEVHETCLPAASDELDSAGASEACEPAAELSAAEELVQAVESDVELAESTPDPTELAAVEEPTESDQAEPNDPAVFLKIANEDDSETESSTINACDSLTSDDSVQTEAQVLAASHEAASTELEAGKSQEDELDSDSCEDDAESASDSPGGLLRELERRQDEVLERLEQLNARIESVLLELGVRLDDEADVA